MVLTVFGVITSDVDVMPPFVFSEPQTQTQHRGLHQVPRGGGGCWKTLSGNRTLHQAESRHGYQISDASGYLPQLQPCCLVYGSQLS